MNNIGLDATYQALAAADAWQTAEIASHGYYEREIDAIIGREPSGGSVAAWFGSMAVTHLAVELVLQKTDHPTMAKWFEYVSIGFEGETVGMNLRLHL